MRGEEENRKLEATLYTKDGHALVVMSYLDTGEEVGFREFATLDAALEWLTAMRWDYKMAA